MNDLQAGRADGAGDGISMTKDDGSGGVLSRRSKSTMASSASEYSRAATARLLPVTR